MAGTDKARLFLKLHELHAQQGKTWKEIEDVLMGEGYHMTANALRKRYSRWSRSEDGIPSNALAASDAESKLDGDGFDFDWLQRG